VSAPHDRTRALIMKGLVRSIGRRGEPGEIYRDGMAPTLDGDWLGGFAQDRTVLTSMTAVSVTAASARFAEGGGVMIDRYGESRLTTFARRDDRVAFTKEYLGGARFHYLGRLHDGEIAGYWQDDQYEMNAGVFWFTRADRVDDSTLDEFRRHLGHSSFNGKGTARNGVRRIDGSSRTCVAGDPGSTGSVRPRPHAACDHEQPHDRPP
jgi:hypothetical protein